MSQVTNLAFFRARRDQSEELGDDADLWFVYENWRSPEGFDAPMLSEHLKAFLKATRMAVSALFIGAGIATASPVFAGTERGSQNMADTSDAALDASLPGDFRNGYAEVNGTRIHYVEGGKGTPVLLLPGWPQTWWEFHKIMPELAKRHRVIAVDLRGMGGSAKPGLGYDKKNMAKDIHELTQA